MARVRSTLPTTRAPTRCSPGDLVREAQMRRLHRRSPMSTTVARYLPMLAPIVLFVACSTDSRDLPWAPSITAHQMAANETWAYDVDKGSWENRHPAVEPPGRFGSMMVYDPRADRVLLFGGALLTDGTGLNDLWAYDYERNTWTERHPAVSPAPHQWHALVYVPTSNRTILFGGVNPVDGSLLNDTWAYDYHRNRWTNLHPRQAPVPRMAHYMAFESRTNRLVMFGGFLGLGDQATNDTWLYDVATNRWSQVFPKESPGPRAWHVMSRTNGPVVLFGGGPDQPGFTNETFLYDSRANRWEQVPGGSGDDDDIARR